MEERRRGGVKEIRLIALHLQRETLRVNLISAHLSSTKESDYSNECLVMLQPVDAANDIHDPG